MNGTGATPATLFARSVVMSCNATKYIGTGSITAAQVAAIFGTGTNGNNDAFTSTLTGVFINGAGENGVTPFDSTTAPGSSFFTKTAWIGAVQNSSDNWYAGWTCDNSIVNFGSGSACTSLPTT
jgi:hypothetical protein